MRRGTLVLHAPQLWLWECGNIIANVGQAAAHQRRRRVAGVERGRRRSARAVELLPPEPAQAASALPLALEHGLSLYDAAYLRLAISLQLPLLTADAALARRAAANGRAAV